MNRKDKFFIRNEANAVPEATNLQDSGVRCIAIGITEGIDEDMLASFSSLPREPNQEYFTSPDFESLGGILDDVLASTDCPAPTSGTILLIYMLRTQTCILLVYTN